MITDVNAWHNWRRTQEETGENYRRVHHIQVTVRPENPNVMAACHLRIPEKRERGEKKK